MNINDAMWDWQAEALKSFIDAGLLSFCSPRTQELVADGMMTLEDVLQDRDLIEALDAGFSMMVSDARATSTAT